MSDEARQRRARERAARMAVVKSQMTSQAADTDRIRGAEAVSLAFELTRMSWAMAGLPVPTYTRRTIPVAFIAPQGR